jgi:zinc protease
MRYENSDRGKLYLNMMKNMFEGTPYGTSVIGDIEDLKSVSRDQIL